MILTHAFSMVKAGCCGCPKSMSKHHESFKLVELREKMPPHFEFMVKKHQDIIHESMFEIGRMSNDKNK